jgi:hypothetical protein
MATPFDTRCGILGELWIKHKNDEAFADFISYNDLGLPIAYGIYSGIINSTPKAEAFINETWDILLGGLEMEDIGFDSLDALLGDDFPDMDLFKD